MSIRLPEHATEASKRRAELAEKLVARCPPELADEIALVGSTARGYADDDSDLELNLWAEAIPPLEARIAWLEAAGASEIYSEEMPRYDQSIWIHGTISGIPVEVGWQTFEAVQTSIRRAVSSEPEKPPEGINHVITQFAEIVVSAIPLRTTGKLQDWQTTLSAYSDRLQSNLVQFALSEWSRVEHFTPMRRLARRGERFTLTYYLMDDLDKVLHLIYAVNRHWEPSNKWTLTVAREFAPFDLDARIDAILGDPSLERRVDLCAQLCLDVLALVPEQYDVSKAVEALKAGL